ncbi:DUF2530 domain-containing protein [Planomonospora sp. ID67723]|uniref:DUF2530 domain-containing protein n=1 Tax=Planomonospora sp. ID67723 TaxID=2738134 RepID=UPI0018C40487|nr:DUF2530 domain-containing protein [Planomonospora sp. ID67723]MBG0826463.1 DUF2530 domain-containing protein [Planomonospora sp. ID67723]
MNEPRRQDLQPLKTNDTATILAGMGLWTIALVVLVVLRPGPEHQWWIWTCVSGLCGGLFGLWYVRRRDRRGPPPLSEEPVEPATAIPPASPAPGTDGSGTLGDSSGRPVT